MARRGRKSRSKQRGKGVGSRSQSAGQSRGGSRSSAGSAGGSRSGGNRSGSGARRSATKSRRNTTASNRRATVSKARQAARSTPRTAVNASRGKAPTSRRQATRVNRQSKPTATFSPSRLSSKDKLTSNIRASFSNPAVQNFGKNFGNWFNLGKNVRIPNEATASYGNFGDMFARDTSKVNPNTLFGDDRLQRGMSNQAFQEGKQSKFLGRPDRAFGVDLGESFKQRKLVKVPAVEGGPMSGPTPLIRRAFTDLGKFVLSPKAALFASNFRVDPLASGTLEGKPTRFNIDAGGLNIGDTTSETEGGRNIRSLKQVTDIGEKRDEATDARTNSFLTNAFNIGTKIPFVGPQLQNLKSDIKPYTDRITVETPKNTKKVISQFVSNLDSMSDTTRRFVNEFATDNPNIPNRFGLETAADVVQTFNPMNKNYAPQLSRSWGKPLEAIANNFVSGGTKNIFQEAALNTGAEGTISPAEGLSIARRIGKNINTPGTLGNFEATKLQNLADQYGGGTIKPTPGTIFRGITGGGGTRNRNRTSLSNSGVTTLAAATPTSVEEVLPLPTTITQTGTNSSNLANIMQNAYQNQMSLYGMNPNYFANIRQPRFNRPTRRFRDYFRVRKD